MRNRNANVFLRGTAIVLLIIATVLTIASLVGYSRQRNDYPAGMTIAGVPVGGLDPQSASQRVLEVYNTPIEIHYSDAIIQADPTNLGFQLDIDSMLAAAEGSVKLAIAMRLLNSDLATARKRLEESGGFIRNLK